MYEYEGVKQMKCCECGIEIGNKESLPRFDKPKLRYHLNEWECKK